MLPGPVRLLQISSKLLDPIICKGRVPKGLERITWKRKDNNEKLLHECIQFKWMHNKNQSRCWQETDHKKKALYRLKWSIIRGNSKQHNVITSIGTKSCHKDMEQMTKLISHESFGEKDKKTSADTHKNSQDGST